MANRFDPYHDELWNCWCPLCMELAGAHTAHIPSALDAASEALFVALAAGTHRRQGPRVSLTKWNPLSVRDDGWKMREGLGIGVTPGGVTGGGRRRQTREERKCD